MGLVKILLITHDVILETAAQFQYPDWEVWALVGDGTFNMTMHDLLTIVEYQLPIKLLVINNKELGFVKIEMEETGLAPNYDAHEVKSPDLLSLAKNMGADGIEVADHNDIVRAIEQARESDKPFILNAYVESGEIALLPQIELEQIKKFGLAKIKEAVKAVKGDKREWNNIKSEVRSLLDQKFRPPRLS